MMKSRRLCKALSMDYQPKKCSWMALISQRMNYHACNYQFHYTTVDFNVVITVHTSRPYFSLIQLLELPLLR